MRFSCGVSLASNSHLFTVKVKGLYTVKFSDSWVKFFLLCEGVEHCYLSLIGIVFSPCDP
jgi:hypothetical protein